MATAEVEGFQEETRATIVTDFSNPKSGHTSGHVPSDMNPDRYPVPARQALW